MTDKRTTDRELVYDREYITVYHDWRRDLVEAVWLRFANSEKYREGTLFCAGYTRENRVGNWVSDRRAMRAIRPVDQEWTVREIAPMLMGSALRRVAIVTSADVFNQMATNAIHVRATGLVRFETRHFADPGSARRWVSGEGG